MLSHIETTLTFTKNWILVMNSWYLRNWLLPFLINSIIFQFKCNSWNLVKGLSPIMGWFMCAPFSCYEYLFILLGFGYRISHISQVYLGFRCIRNKAIVVIVWKVSCCLEVRLNIWKKLSFEVFWRRNSAWIWKLVIKLYW
jgi:hypothetical protein